MSSTTHEEQPDFSPLGDKLELPPKNVLAKLWEFFKKPIVAWIIVVLISGYFIGYQAFVKWKNSLVIGASQNFVGELITLISKDLKNTQCQGINLLGKVKDPINQQLVDKQITIIDVACLAPAKDSGQALIPKVPAPIDEIPAEEIPSE